MLDYIAVHENAAADYDQMAAEATTELARRMYRELAKKRRQQAEMERRHLAEAKQRALLSEAKAQRDAQDKPDFYWNDYGAPI